MVFVIQLPLSLSLSLSLSTIDRPPQQWRTQDCSCRHLCLNFPASRSLSNETPWSLVSEETNDYKKEAQFKDSDAYETQPKTNLRSIQNCHCRRFMFGRVSLKYLQASKSSLNLSSVNSSRRSLYSLVCPDITTMVKTSRQAWWGCDLKLCQRSNAMTRGTEGLTNSRVRSKSIGSNQCNSITS